MADENDLDIREIRTDIKWIRQKMESHCDEMRCLNNRVSSLEIWRSGIVAGLALLMILIGWGWVQPG
jgi:hypothetical protein